MTEKSYEIKNPDQLRVMFRTMNKFMVLMWKLGLADWLNIWPSVFGQILVLTHTGRKTGLKRQTPTNFAIIEGEV